MVCRASPPLARNGAAIGAGLSANGAKYWSEWQDLNLRPPRPERGVLPFGRFADRRAGVSPPLRGSDNSEIPHLPSVRSFKQVGQTKLLKLLTLGTFSMT